MPRKGGGVPIQVIQYAVLLGVESEGLSLGKPVLDARFKSMNVEEPTDNTLTSLVVTSVRPPLINGHSTLVAYKYPLF